MFLLIRSSSSPAHHKYISMLYYISLNQINLEKREERWWEAVLTTEEKISVRKIDASRPMTDLDDEAQAKIEEMMYNEQQKRMGKPTSQEQVYRQN